MSFRSLKLEMQTDVPELNALECGVRLNRAYQTLLDMHQWSFLKQEALIQTVAPYNTGTVTVALGGTTVTGAATVWTAAMANRYIRFSSQSEFYKISSVNALAQTLVIEKAAGEAVTAGGYTIFQHHYAKPTSCKHIVSLRRQLVLGEHTKEWLDGFDPDRDSTGEPIYWCNFDEDNLEVYPVPDAIYTIRVGYILEVADVTTEAGTFLIPERLVLAYALMRSYRTLSTHAEKGQAYNKLYTDAKEEFKIEWQAAYEADLSKQSLPTQVLQDGVDLPVSSQFWLSHDDFWPGRPGR